jgi:hypothetical protein
MAGAAHVPTVDRGIDPPAPTSSMVAKPAEGAERVAADAVNRVAAAVAAADDDDDDTAAVSDVEDVGMDDVWASNERT